MRLALLLLLLLVSPQVRAADSHARVDLSPKAGVWVGQRVTLAVTLYTPDLFAGAPAFDLPPVPGAVMLPPAGSPIVGSETVGGASYTTQRHEFAVYAQRAGTVKVPAFTVQFDSNTGFGTPTVRRRVTTTAVSFAAKAPPGADGLGVVIAAHDLKVTDKWDPEPRASKVGNAFTRTTTVTAGDVPGMVFPALQHSDIGGLAAYPKDPTVSDHTERGVLTGTRVETITYVCERSGTVTVPDRTLTWFDLDTNELKTVNLPGRTFKIASAPEPVAAPPPAAPPVRSNRWETVAVALGAVLVGGGLARRAWLWGARRHADWRASEPAAFASLRRECRAGEPHAVFVALLQWLDRTGIVSLAELEYRGADPELTRAIADLEARVYARSDDRSREPWSAEFLIARLANTRSTLRFGTPAPERGALPPLNPSG